MENNNIQFIEYLAANAWQPETKDSLGGWELRYSRGITRRGNSVLPLKDDGKVKLSEKIDAIEAFYSKKRLASIFQLTEAAQPSGLYADLKKRGYKDNFFTEVQMASPERVLANPRKEYRFSAIIRPKLDHSWFEVYTQIDQHSELSLEVRENILLQVPKNACFLSLKDGEKIIAVGLGVVEKNYMGVYCMVTSKEHRRRGAAYEALHRLAIWGKNQAVKQIYLQVMANNLPALALYENAGFKKEYLYWYSEKNV